MTDAQAVAEQLLQETFLQNEAGWREWYRLTNDGKKVRPPNGMAVKLRDAIAAALDAREREVWEKAATEVMRYHNAFLHNGFRGELKRLAEWCRRQGGGG